MKMIVIGLLFCSSAMAAIPFSPELDKELRDIKAGTTMGAASIGLANMASNSVEAAQIVAGALTEADGAAYNVEGLHFARVARVTYDVATDLGTIAAHPLGVTLPAKSVILAGTIQVVTQFEDAGSGTVALHCEDANNIKTATDITGSAAQALIATATLPVGAINAACEVTATVAGAAQTAGKLILTLVYVVGE